MTSPLQHLTRLRQFTRSAALACALAAGLSAVAQTTQLQPAPDRITDEAIQADQQAYEQLQARIKGLNDRGRPVRDYHLSKAQCWLDVSFHEYNRNDRGPFPQAAMTESEKLIVGMEQGRSPLPMDTPLVGEAVKLRPDLWDRAQALLGHPGRACAQQKVACAEVELVHAGNEHAQQQWRHAKPYVQIAEDLLAEGQALADSCLPAPKPQPAPDPEPKPPVVLPPVQDLVLGAQVVFNFDRFEPGQVRPFSVVQLEQLVQRIKNDGLQVQAISLVGHADRLNSTGESTYNQTLSEKRVATVRDMLVKLGVDPGVISTNARGDQQQIVGCESRFSSKADLEECLLPNRRVEVGITARKR